LKRRLPRLSGREVIAILVSRFGFTVVWRKGSHVVLRKYVGGRKIVTVVPLHPELEPGTLLGVLELAGVSREEFLEALDKRRLLASWELIEGLLGYVDGVSRHSLSLRRSFRLTSSVFPFFLSFSYSLIASISSGKGSSIPMSCSSGSASMRSSIVLSSRSSLYNSFSSPAVIMRLLL